MKKTIALLLCLCMLACRWLRQYVHDRTTDL